MLGWITCKSHYPPCSYLMLMVLLHTFAWGIDFTALVGFLFNRGLQLFHIIQIIRHCAYHPDLPPLPPYPGQPLSPWHPSDTHTHTHIHTLTSNPQLWTGKNNWTLISVSILKHSMSLLCLFGIPEPVSSWYRHEQEAWASTWLGPTASSSLTLPGIPLMTCSPSFGCTALVRPSRVTSTGSWRR